MTVLQSNKGTILFAQVNRFSYTNDALSSSMKPYLDGLKLEEIRTYPIIRKNPFWLVCCLVAVAWHYGIGAFRDPKSISEKMIKTPFFFDLSGWLVRRKASTIGDLVAVLQTQGLFNAKYRNLPLVIYTDSTILNRINRASLKGARPNPIVGREKQLYKTADLITVTAKHVAVSLVEDYDIQQSRVEVVLIGANAPRSPSSPESRYASKHILFVGIDWDRKGGPDLVKAFEAVAEDMPDAKLTIVGCNPSLSHENIEIKGRIPPAEVAELMATSSVYCMPSHIEPSSVAVIEAARSGLPVVGTDTGGFLDSVVPEETGILVRPGDVQALRSALARLLASAELCERMGKAGQDWVKQFDWSVVSEKLVKSMSRLSTAEEAHR